MKIWLQTATLLKKSLIRISHLCAMIETSSGQFQWWWGQEGGWRRGGRGGHQGQQVRQWGGQGGGQWQIFILVV